MCIFMSFKNNKNNVLFLVVLSWGGEREKVALLAATRFHSTGKSAVGVGSLFHLLLHPQGWEPAFQEVPVHKRLPYFWRLGSS